MLYLRLLLKESFAIGIFRSAKKSKPTLFQSSLDFSPTKFSRKNVNIFFFFLLLRLLLTYDTLYEIEIHDTKL